MGDPPELAVRRVARPHLNVRPVAPVAAVNVEDEPARARGGDRVLAVGERAAVVRRQPVEAGANLFIRKKEFRVIAIIHINIAVDTGDGSIA